MLRETFKRCAQLLDDVIKLLTDAMSLGNPRGSIVYVTLTVPSAPYQTRALGGQPPEAAGSC
jgi:hypothetical protein